jgi:hypothetical protein
MMLKALMVENEDIAKVQAVLPNIAVDYNVGENATGKQIVSFTEESYIGDCNSRAETAAYAFYYNSNGFTADVNLEKANYVFFSVPFEGGWTAFVNGKPVEILKVNAGFMAVLAPEGSSRIVFEYETPGLKIGLLITVITALLSAVYVAVILIKRVYRPITDIEYPEGEEIERRKAALKAAEEALEKVDNDDLLAEIDHDKIDAYQGFKGGFKIDESVFEELETFRIENSLEVETTEEQNDLDGE